MNFYPNELSDIFRYIKLYEYSLLCNLELRNTLQFRNVYATLALSKSLTMQLGTRYQADLRLNSHD
jgi:hypothetical protein